MAKKAAGRKPKSTGDETPHKPVLPTGGEAAAEPLTGRASVGERAGTAARLDAGAESGAPLPPTFIDGDGTPWTVSLSNSGLPTMFVMAKSKDEAQMKFVRHFGIRSTTQVFTVAEATDDKKNLNRKAAIHAARASIQKENPGLGADGGDPSGPFPGGRFNFAPGAESGVRATGRKRTDGGDDSDVDADPFANPDDGEDDE